MWPVTGISGVAAEHSVVTARCGVFVVKYYRELSARLSLWSRGRIFPKVTTKHCFPCYIDGAAELFREVVAKLFRKVTAELFRKLRPDCVRRLWPNFFWGVTAEPFC